MQIIWLNFPCFGLMFQSRRESNVIRGQSAIAIQVRTLKYWNAVIYQCKWRHINVCQTPNTATLSISSNIRPFLVSYQRCWERRSLRGSLRGLCTGLCHPFLIRQLTWDRSAIIWTPIELNVGLDDSSPKQTQT